MVKIISDYGFCFGVEAAIEQLLSKKGAKGKIYLTHPLLHNLPENERIMKKVDASIIKDDTTLNKEDIIVLSAHGHKIEEEQRYASLAEILDCTCPLIVKRYSIIKSYDTDTSFLYLGKKNHQETIGFLSHFPYFQFIDSTKDVKLQISSINLKNKVVFVPQTTVSETTWNKVKNALAGHDIVQILPICPLYQRRSKQSIEQLRNVDMHKSIFLVCGDKASSNAKEIYQSIKEAYPEMNGFIVLKKEDFDYQEYSGKDIYIASATSVSKSTVEELKKDLETL